MKEAKRRNINIFFRTFSISVLLLFCLMALALGFWYCDQLMQTVMG